MSRASPIGVVSDRAFLCYHTSEHHNLENTMRRRKTISIETLTKKVNNMLKESTCGPEMRDGMIAVLTTALHETNNYNGFRYLNGWPCDDATRVEFFTK